MVTTIGRRGSGARITKVDAACTFQNQVAVGQIIVAGIDGRLVTKLDDLYMFMWEKNGYENNSSS
jgi:hypothetical protein